MIPHLLGFALTAAVILALSRALPLRGPRRSAVIAVRLGALACVLLALQGASCRRRMQQARHIVYLVDASASMDEGRTAWAARRLASLESLRPAQMTRTLIAFAEDAQALSPSDREPLTDPQAIAAALRAAGVRRTATNLEAGLLAGAAELSTRHRGRVILISDGRQTQGSVDRILPHLRREGVEVYPVAVPAAETSQVSWEQLIVPPVVRQGASIPAKLLMTSGASRPQPVEVTVQVGGLPILQRRLTLRPGWQVLPLAIPALKSGTFAFEVAVADAGGAALPQRSAVVEVEGPPRVLWVQEPATTLPLLAAALKRRQIEVSVVRPEELPAEAGPLLDYDAVLLFQLPKSSVTAPQAAALRTYVERLGGGLVMVGLGGRLDEELSQEAPLDALLPVRFEPKGLQESKRRVCVVMLIDRSASMLGPRIAATKRGAVELVKQLAPDDLVGVLAFDTVPYVVVELQPAREVTRELIEKLVRLKSTGGTDILPALKAAGVRLSVSGAAVKHILLLSDGNTPVDSAVYGRLLEEFRGQRVTVSTIGIGSAFVNTDFLKWLSTSTGGTFYQMITLEELPTLIARDTERAMGHLPFTEGTFLPRRAEGAEWFAGVSDWPFLRGYLTATAKPGAQLELEMVQGEQHDPLLAHWRLGLGQVAVFASDADQRWAPDWIRWSGFEAAWAEVLRRAMRSRPAEELFVWVDAGGAQPQLIIDGALQAPEAELFSGEGAAAPLALVPQGAFRWRAAMGHAEAGWHRLVIRPGGPGGGGVVTRWIQVGAEDARLEQPRLPPDDLLLRRIAQATRGDAEVPDRAFLPPVEWTEASVPWLTWLLPLALVLMLADIALRGKTML